MTTPFTAYCSLDFLISFYRGAPEGSAFGYSEEDELWHEVRKFFLRHTHIVVDATVDEAKDRVPALLDLISRGRFRHVAFDPDQFRDIGKVGFHARHAGGAIFFLEGVDHARLSERFGALFLSFGSLYPTWRRVARRCTYNVKPKRGVGGMKGLGDLREHACPTTRLLISDPYMAANLRKYDAFEENLGVLLLSLLPRGHNEIPVRLTVATKLYDDKKGLVADPSEMRDRVKRYLDRHRPDLTVEVRVVEPHESPHDRRVFTDYGFFKCDYGWVLFGKDGKAIKETTVEYGSVLDAEVREVAVDKHARVSEAALQAAVMFKDGKPLKLQA